MQCWKYIFISYILKLLGMIRHFVYFFLFIVSSTELIFKLIL